MARAPLCRVSSDAARLGGGSGASQCARRRAASGDPCTRAAPVWGSASLTGLIFALYGVVGLVSGVVVGQHNSELRERTFIVAGSGLMSVGTLLLAVHGPLVLVLLGVSISGLGVGPGTFRCSDFVNQTDPPGDVRPRPGRFDGAQRAGNAPRAALAGGLCATGQTTLAFVVGGLMSLMAVGLTVPLIPFR